MLALSVMDKKWEQPKYSGTKEWVSKMKYVYTTEYYSAIKKNEINNDAQHNMDESCKT
jgi:hypothetical protein